MSHPAKLPALALAQQAGTREAALRRLSRLFAEAGDLFTQLAQAEADAALDAAPRARWVSTAQAAAAWGVHPATVRDWARTGRIAAYQVDGTRWLVDLDAPLSPTDSARQAEGA